MKKLNKKQKDHIKSIFFKGLHVICYILSVLFIVLCVIVGANSCQQRNTRGVSAESYDVNNRYKYTLIFGEDSSGNIELSTQNKILDKFNLSNDDVDGTSVVLQSYVVDLPINTQLEIGFNNLVDVPSFQYDFVAYNGDGVSGRYWRLDSLSVVFEDGSSSLLLQKYNSYYNDYAYNTFYDVDYFSVINFYSVGANQYLFDMVQLDTFVFNKVFNYNAPMGLTLSSPYGQSALWTDTPSSYDAHIYYDVGWFVSNGQLFNRIVYRCSDSASMYFDFGNNQIKQGGVGWSYSTLEYWNTSTNSVVIVNMRDIVAFMPSSTTYAYYQSNSATWQVDDYRSLYFIDSLSQSNINALNRFNNNNQNSYSGNVTGGDINNIFTLIGSAFTSLLPVMSTYLLPGITIGTLLFIPLVALLVFAIIRIIKK